MLSFSVTGLSTVYFLFVIILSKFLTVIVFIAYPVRIKI